MSTIKTQIFYHHGVWSINTISAPFKQLSRRTLSAFFCLSMILILLLNLRDQSMEDPRRQLHFLLFTADPKQMDVEDDPVKHIWHNITTPTHRSIFSQKAAHSSHPYLMFASRGVIYPFFYKPHVLQYCVLSPVAKITPTNFLQKR